MKYSNDYTIVAEAKGQTVLAYEQFGSYQGDWIMVSKDNDNYYIYKDYYGSCTSCDKLQGEFGFSDDITDAKAKEFAANYNPFLVIQKDVFKKMIKNGKLIDLFPANIFGYETSKETVKKFLDSISEEKRALNKLKQ